MNSCVFIRKMRLGRDGGVVESGMSSGPCLESNLIWDTVYFLPQFHNPQSTIIALRSDSSDSSY